MGIWRGHRRLGVALALPMLGLGLGGALPQAKANPPEERRRFIVTLQDSVTNPRAVAAQHAADLDVDVDYVYEHALKGYAGTFQASAMGQLARDSRVARVEQDGPVTGFTTQTGATWGLDRIDQRNLPLSGTFTHTRTGAGVTAYIVDTGIRFSHAEFEGRATSGFDAVDGGSADDCNGHGTHVAGTVGGRTYGVAKAVNLVAVRVLDCNGLGSVAGAIAGLDWIKANHAAQPAVANMSLGGGASTALDNAVRSTIADGVSLSVAAGNGVLGLGVFAQNACSGSPSRVAEAITVSATERTDRKASWANYGDCVDLFAPGVDITSAWSTDDTATNTIAGTSMAAPHAAGVAALFLETTPGATPATVHTALAALATTGVVTSSRTTNPRLLFTSY